MKFFLLSFFLSVSFAAFSQTSVSINDEPTVVETEWDFYSDEENEAIYIDFRDINQNLREIVVLNEDQEVVFREDVQALPVDSIYELNYAEYLAGVYTIELRSYTRVLRQDLHVE